MNLILIRVAAQATRELAQSALPGAPTVADEPPRGPGAVRRAIAASLRWSADRLAPRPATDRLEPGAAC